MFFIHGSGTKVVVVRSEGVQECPECECEQPFSLVLRYDYDHAFFILGVVTHRAYREVCGGCGEGWLVDRRKVERTLKRVPIPFLRRWGCLMIVGAMVAFFLLMLVVSALDNN
jgi:hypothetical protein